MVTEIIIGLVAVFLVFITLVRREMLKEKAEIPQRRAENRRHDKRRAHTGRRVHEFHSGCEIKNRRKNEDRRNGSKDRRRKERRHTPKAA